VTEETLHLNDEAINRKIRSLFLKGKVLITCYIHDTLQLQSNNKLDISYIMIKDKTYNF